MNHSDIEQRIADKEYACRKERQRFVAKAITSRTRMKLPLNVDALAREAIRLADRGTSYSQFMRDLDREGFESDVVGKLRDEVARQLGAAQPL